LANATPKTFNTECRFRRSRNELEQETCRGKWSPFIRPELINKSKDI
jgi:hypothetical protein